VAGFLCLHPRVFGAVTGALLRRLGRPPLPKVPALREYLYPMVLLLVTWLLFGAALWFMARALAPVFAVQVLVMTAAGAAAGIIGFLAFFAPAGLGVREGILLAILGPGIGPDNAAIVVVGIRLVSTVVEVLQAGVGLVILRRRGRQAPVG
jgi:uncharacterized membrane protein YbhN (UPF0104 family)